MKPQKLQGLELFDVYHQVAIVFSFSFIIFLLLLSNQIKTDKRAIVIKYLIFFTFIQEIIDYLGRIQFNGLSLEKDLPLHLCHYGLFMGLFSLYRKNQFCFEFTLLIGIPSALLAIITPDMNDYNNWTNYVTFFIHHSLIIVFPLWNIFVDNLSLRRFSIFYSSFFCVIMIIPVGLVCWVTGGNYMYLRKAPAVNNPLLFGDWPFYILNCIIIGFILISLSFSIYHLCIKLSRTIKRA
mgnify:CR=1 FL=1